MATELDEIDSLANMIFDKYHALKPGEDTSQAFIDATEAEDLAIAAHALVKNRGSEDKCEGALASISFVLTMMFRDEWHEIIVQHI